jgi:hypothetical protein
MKYTHRRVQFGRTLSDIPAIQFYAADMISSVLLGHSLTYYTAYNLDQGRDVALSASVAKQYTTDALMKTTLDAVQCHGGDGYTRQYPVERHMRDSKLIQIGAGSNEILRTLIFKQWEKDSDAVEASTRKSIEEVAMHMDEAKEKTMDLLARDYRRNPGLYMRTYELKAALKCSEEVLEQALIALEEEKQVALYRVRKKILLAKATYDGLAKAKPKEFYRFIPDFVDKEKEVF